MIFKVLTFDEDCIIRPTLFAEFILIVADVRLEQLVNIPFILFAEFILIVADVRLEQLSNGEKILLI